MGRQDAIGRPMEYIVGRLDSLTHINSMDMVAFHSNPIMNMVNHGLCNGK